MNIKSEQEMLNFGATFARQLLTSDQTDAVIELVGDVGAGKTTFTRGLARGLGITQPITSPSFTISKSYAFPGGHTLTHYDFYRLDHPGLMLDDLRDAIKSHHLIIVEWGESVENILPTNHIQIHFKLLDDGSREVKIVKGGDQSGSSPILLLRQAELVPAPEHEDLARAARSVSGAELICLRKIGEEPLSVDLFLDTSTPTTLLKLNDKEYRHEFGNTLSQNLLSFIHDKLKENHFDWHDIKKITFMSGPGSFTGLRIGASVVNTLAHELDIPLYDHHGERHQIILPDYGRPANITVPKK